MTIVGTNITINFTSNTFHGDTVKSVKNLISNVSNPVTNTIKLSASSVKEGKAGIKIGTLSCGNLTGNFEFIDWRSSRFEIKGNDLYLNQAYMFDYEKQAIHTDILGWGNWNSWSENDLT